MRKSVLVIAALLASTFVSAVSAQPAFIERKQVSPTTARKLVDACIARAEQQKQMAGCAVVDIASFSASMKPAIVSLRWMRPMIAARNAPAAPPSVGVTTPA